MSSFEKKLNDILAGGDIDKAIDDLPEDEEEQTKPPEELLPVKYEQKESSLDIANADLREDYNFARSNLYGLIGKSNASLELALQIAQMSEHPRALEVAAQMMKTSSDMTKELIKLQKEVEGNKSGGDSQAQTVYNTQNNYYSNPNDIDQLLDDYEDSEQEDEGKDSGKTD